MDMIPFKCCLLLIVLLFVQHYGQRCCFIQCFRNKLEFEFMKN